jgi:nicotinamide-nucleotide amidase
MNCCAEIIGVGTELLLGNIVNTDARDISEALSALGINVFWHTVVGDNPERLKAAVEIAKGRADIIITTGGLGPTCDDLTKQTLAECFGLPLVFNEEEAEKIRGFFSSLGNHRMPENNLSQARLPEGCVVLKNHNGTAPGCAFYAGGKHVLMLPGPPRELKVMLEREALPYLRKLSDSLIVSHDIRLFGIGESAAEERLRGLMLSLTNPTLAPYAGTGEVRLRVTAKASSQDEAETLMAPVIEKVKEAVGEYIYGIDIPSLEAAAYRLLKERKLTLAAAESCTGGLIAKRITDIPGASEVFKGGIVSYTNEVKHRVLGVSAETLEKHGAVSRETALEMAEGARYLTGASIAVSATGVCGPVSDDRGTVVGTGYIALAAAGKSFCREIKMGNDRDRGRTVAAHHAFDMIIRYINGTLL